MSSATPRSFNAANSTRRATSTPSSRRPAKPTSGPALRRAYRAAGAAAARRQLTALATWLARNGQADAAASVREGAGGDAYGAEARPAAGAAPLLRDDELHRESDRHAAARHAEHQALARWRHAAAVDRARPGPR